MEKIYVFTGKEPYLIKKEIDKILNEESIAEYEHLFFDAKETPIEDLLLEIKTISLFDAGKVIIIDNLEAYDKVTEKQLAPFLKFLKEPTDGVILIISTSELGNIKNLEESLSKYSYIVNVKELGADELIDYVKNEFNANGITIDKKATEELILRTNSDLFAISNEILKLSAYRFDTKVVSLDDIKGLVHQSVDDNIYDLSQALIEQDKQKVVQILYNLLSINIDPLMILGHLVYRLQEIMYAQALTKQGYSKEKLMEYFHVSSGRLYYIMKNSNQLSQKRLESLYKKFANLDYQIKSGKIDKKIGLELLLLGEI